MGCRRAARGQIKLSECRRSGAQQWSKSFSRFPTSTCTRLWLVRGASRTSTRALVAFVQVVPLFEAPRLRIRLVGGPDAEAEQVVEPLHNTSTELRLHRVVLQRATSTPKRLATRHNIARRTHLGAEGTYNKQGVKVADAASTTAPTRHDRPHPRRLHDRKAHPRRLAAPQRDRPGGLRERHAHAHEDAREGRHRPRVGARAGRLSRVPPL